jgi:hypothetical protein
MGFEKALAGQNCYRSMDNENIKTLDGDDNFC